MTRLPEPLRAVIVLRYFQGLDWKVVAARLGLPASTVRTRQQRALEKLRSDLDRRCEGGRKAWGLLLVPLLRDTSPGAVVLGSWPIWLACAGAACALAVVGASSLTQERSVEGAGPAIAARGAGAPEAPASEFVPLAFDTPAEGGRVAASPSAAAVSPGVSEVSGIVLVDGRPPEWPIRLSLEPTMPPLPAIDGAMREPTGLPELVLSPGQRGVFSFDGLSPAWRGKLRVDGYRFADGESSIVLASPASGLVLDLLSGPEIVGRIVGRDGLTVGDLQGAYELRTGKEGAESDELLMAQFLCRADGAFRIPILTRTDWGTVTILFEAEGQGYLHHESARFAVATGTNLGELALEPVRALEFTVRDAGGAPIKGAFARVDDKRATIEPAFTHINGIQGVAKKRPLTDADGFGVLDPVPDRAVSVRFGAFAHRDRVMSVEPGDRVEVVLEPLAVLDIRFGGSAERLRVSAERSAFVWDDDGWDEGAAYQFELGWTRPCRKSIPAAPGQRFEYEFHASPEGRLQLVGIRPDLALTVEALDAHGTSLAARYVTVEARERRAIDLRK